jgi:predicted amidohydrolase YtcJ
MDQVARLVLHNGTVRTLDPAGTVAEAVAIAGSRILAVGSSSDMTALADRRTEVIDLGGRTVLPAFTDSHMHFRRASIGMAYHLDFLQLKPRSIGDVLDSVRTRTAAVAPGAWIQGETLIATDLAEQRFPDRWELDTVAPSNPVVLRSMGEHVI